MDFLSEAPMFCRGGVQMLVRETTRARDTISGIIKRSFSIFCILSSIQLSVHI